MNAVVLEAAADASGFVSPGLDGLVERDHELRAALFGIEASAVGLSEHRDRLTSGQVDELMAGLVAEICRVRSLFDGRTGTPSTFDVGDAIAPVIACARASGLVVRSSVPGGIEVEGRRDSTAQVALALLDNARKHAPSSPVEVRVAVFGDAVALYVEDRGSGIAGPLRKRVFERGACGDNSVGSGLGLYVARRLMAKQGGTIEIRSRRGGGASFVLRFRRTPAR